MTCLVPRVGRLLEEFGDDQGERFGNRGVVVRGEERTAGDVGVNDFERVENVVEGGMALRRTYVKTFAASRAKAGTHDEDLKHRCSYGVVIASVVCTLAHPS